MNLLNECNINIKSVIYTRIKSKSYDQHKSAKGRKYCILFLSKFCLLLFLYSMDQDLGKCHTDITAITSSFAGLYIVVSLICVRIIVANLAYCSVGPSCICGFAFECAWSNTQEDAPVCWSFTCQ